jgi:hypothetical protein
MSNLLALAYKLSEAERKLLVEVIGRHYPGKPVIDYNNVKLIALLHGECVIVALRHDYCIRRRMAARALANKLRVALEAFQQLVNQANERPIP